MTVLANTTKLVCGNLMGILAVPDKTISDFFLVPLIFYEHSILSSLGFLNPWTELKVHLYFFLSPFLE